ncbi:MAG: LytTR family DNA-binding domain-containing protein [Oscillospiraceae bacterium]|nr:LytTR family DNA-binding domain-containing protein [Oscillospiraceae bacterium]
MKVSIMVEPSRQEPEAVIYTERVTEEVRQAEALLLGGFLNGYSGERVTRLPFSELIRVYGESRKVYAQTADGLYLLHQRLYELDTLLGTQRFLRISNAEIVNSAAIRHLDISLAGTIGVELSGGIRTYASRRYVKKIRELLGL